MHITEGIAADGESLLPEGGSSPAEIPPLRTVQCWPQSTIMLFAPLLVKNKSLPKGICFSTLVNVYAFRYVRVKVKIKNGIVS